MKQGRRAAPRRRKLHILPILLAGVLMLATRKAGWDSLDVFRNRKTMALCGAALGLGAVWANDYGYAAIGAGLCILLVLTVFQNPRRPLAKLLDYLTFLGCTLAGYLLHYHEALPAEGETVESEGLRVTVEKIERRRITSVRVSRIEPTSA